VISKPFRLALAIAAFLVGLIAISWFARQYRSTLIGHAIDSNNTVGLNGFAYTVTNAFHTNRIRFATAENGTAYLVVNLKVENSTPRTAECYAKFHIFSGEGFRYDVDADATWNAENGHSFGVKILPKFSKPVAVAFLVPTESLSRPLTLDIEDRLSSGMIKIGPPGGTLTRD